MLNATRASLFSKPDSFFAGMLNGRQPTPSEKLLLVERAIQRLAATPMYKNDLYTVQIESCPPFVHLHIHRNDWGPCKDWREFQLIKNQLVGEENEAVELFPRKAGSWTPPIPTTCGCTPIRNSASRSACRIG